MINRIKYWWFRHQNSYPCQAEIAELLREYPIIKVRVGRMVLAIATHYATSSSIEETATTFTVTRERVRQCLNKFRRNCLKASKELDKYYERHGY